MSEQLKNTKFIVPKNEDEICYDFIFKFIIIILILYLFYSTFCNYSNNKYQNLNFNPDDNYIKEQLIYKNLSNIDRQNYLNMNENDKLNYLNNYINN